MRIKDNVLESLGYFGPVLNLFDEKKFLHSLKRRLILIEGRHNTLSDLAVDRFSNEKLLQLEVMSIISKMRNTVDYLPEKSYNNRSKDKCDFWFKNYGSEYWMEMKMCPTNYKKEIRHAKAVTDSINSIINDVNRLKGVDGKRYILFAVYPMYEDRKAFFAKYLDKIAHEIAQEAKVKPEPNFEIKLNGDAHGGVFMIYLLKM